MNLISYKAHSGKEDLAFDRINFERLNLIVGDSATGKTRLLNTIFNSGLFVTQRNQIFVGMWDIVFEHDEIRFHWQVETSKDENDETTITHESISIIEGENKEKILVDRNKDTFVYNDKELPKLSHKESAISILKDEEAIKPMYKGLSSIIRRNFSGSSLEEQTTLQTVPLKFLNKIKKSKNITELFEYPSNLSFKLFILSEIFPSKYESICKNFKSVFPFVTELNLFGSDKFGFPTPNLVPVFALKEKDINEWIQIKEFSSGMLKILLLLTDVEMFPDYGVVYLIDEIENSLGISAINSFPIILLNTDTASQFIITSHHPYIVNNIPIKNWIVLHRKGKVVSSKQGSELESKYGKSKQKAFIQLINDSFYSTGIE